MSSTGNREAKRSPEFLRIQFKSGHGPTFVPERAHQRTPNAIRTTRFTILSWIPKSLYWQFHRAANVYFVCIAAVSTIPFIDAKWQPKVLTVVLILLAQALKDLYEDLKRWRDDQAENMRMVRRFDLERGSFEEAQWCEIDVGDIIIIEKGRPFPVDTLVVASAEESGNFYVATKSIDGETNLKERYAPKVINDRIRGEDADKDAEGRQDAIASRLYDISLQIVLETPHPSVMDMDCSVMLGEGAATGVSKSNFGLRGCEVMSVSWVLGVACYVGNDTKVRLNSFPPPSKSSELEKCLNNCVLCILAFLFSVSFYFALASQFVVHISLPFYKIFMKYLVILYPVLPMTLYIAFEILHLIIGVQIEVDPLMRDPVLEQNAKARNTSVVEELGQVDFVFSDKTGTLTANEMRFAYCCVGSATLGPFLSGAGGQPGAGLEQAKAAMKGVGGGEVSSFFNALAVCHTVKIDEDGTFQGESPDEVALVQAASAVGVVLEGRETSGSSVIHRVRSPWGTEDNEVTHVLGFNSDRKRMSVVCATQDGGAVVTTKGADSVMELLLTEPLPHEASRALADFSRQGLRTLLVARRRIAPVDFKAWRARWDEASSAMEGRAAKLAAVSASIEEGLTYTGVTALEDRLQDRVPATIATLRRAGVRIWVLTGDKVETALEIAKSCKLIDSGMRLISVINTQLTKECRRILQEALDRPDEDGPKGLPVEQGMVLDGGSVGYILEDKQTRRALYELGAKSSSCVCCRLSPLQKRELVELVRQENPKAITLAIGDGANDVPMIQGAHVGIGVRGKEGSAAVQASDMAVSQFSFLGNLVLCHGRKSYRRIATFLCFFIYKSVALGWSYIVYAHSMLFSGEGAYPQWLDVIWNPLTSCAVVLILASDVDVTDEVALQRPELYSPGPARKLFNPATFARWMVIATIHGILAWCVPVYGLTPRADRLERPLPEGGPFWQASFTAFTTIYVIVHLKLLWVAEKPLQWIGLLSVVLELGVYVPVAIGLGSEMAPSHELLQAPQRVFSSWPLVATIFVVPVIALMPDVLEALCARKWQRCRRSSTSRSDRSGSRSLVQSKGCTTSSSDGGDSACSEDTSDSDREHVFGC